MLVGMATTGTLTSPPTTEGRAPSIPAATIITGLFEVVRAQPARDEFRRHPHPKLVRPGCPSLPLSGRLLQPLECRWFRGDYGDCAHSNSVESL